MSCVLSYVRALACGLYAFTCELRALACGLYAVVDGSSHATTEATSKMMSGLELVMELLAIRAIGPHPLVHVTL